MNPAIRPVVDIAVIPRLTALMIIPITLVACGGGGGGGGGGEGTTDYTAPVLDVVFAEAPAATTTAAYARFVFAATDATAYKCRLDGDSYADCASPLFIAGPGQGLHRIDVRAISADGEMGEPASHEWHVDSLFNVGHDDLVSTNQAPAAVAPNSWRGILRINCDFSHSSYNDPIVYPGLENAAHLHRFYGNLLVDHNTTLESIYSSGDSSCQGGELNRSSYWMPALLAPSYDPETGERLRDANDEPAWQVVPAVVGNDEEAHEVFYYSAGIDDLEAIQPIPAGLRMIAGSAGTMPGQQQDTAIVRWHCQSWGSDDSSNPQFSATVPECAAPDRVRVDIFFPSCWNGVDLDSPDHKSHMAYPVNQGGPAGTRCPDTHPVPIVRPSYHFAFGVKPEVYDPATQTSRGWRLASDMYDVSSAQPGGLSLHADWFNGWHPEIMQLILDGCIKGELDCHDGNLGNGYRLSGTQPGSQQEPAIINGGMGY